MLKSKRLILSELKEAYADDLTDLWNDFDVIRYTNCTLINNAEECRERIAYFNSHSKNGRAVNFAIFYGDELIGICGLPPIKNAQNEYGIFYQFKRKYWRKGFASEIVPVLCKYAFEKLGAKNIYADSVIANVASIKTLEKCGFEQTGTEKCGFKNNGCVIDVIHFMLKNSNYNNGGIS